MSEIPEDRPSVDPWDSGGLVAGAPASFGPLSQIPKLAVSLHADLVCLFFLPQSTEVVQAKDIPYLMQLCVLGFHGCSGETTFL